MESNEKKTPLPDPEELEMKSLLERVTEIAKKKEIPFLSLATLPSLKTNMIAAIGCPHCITDLLKNALKQDPILYKILMSGFALHMLEKEGKSVPDIDLDIINHAKKNTPTGN